MAELLFLAYMFFWVQDPWEAGGQAPDDIVRAMDDGTPIPPPIPPPPHP